MPPLFSLQPPSHQSVRVSCSNTADSRAALDSAPAGRPATTMIRAASVTRHRRRMTVVSANAVRETPIEDLPPRWLRGGRTRLNLFEAFARAVAPERAVLHQHMEMRMQMRQRAERLNAHDQARHQLGFMRKDLGPAGSTGSRRCCA